MNRYGLLAVIIAAALLAAGCAKSTAKKDIYTGTNSTQEVII